MLEKIKTALLGMVTEHDNKTHDPLKWGAAIGVISVLGLAGYHEYQKVHVSEKDLAYSLTAILTGCGVGVGVKKNSEHDDEPEKGGA